MPIRQFANRIAVVTGAASGIGRAIAQELARRGCHLALVDKNVEGLETLRSVVAGLGRQASNHVCDVSVKESVFSLSEEVLRCHPGVHLLVNCAGVSLAGRFEETSLEDLEWIFGINFWGTVYGCKAFLPWLMKQEEAHIVNVCSSFGLLGFAGKTGYSSTKFAVRGFSESLRAELLDSSVGVTVLYPGPVNTQIVRQGRVVNESQREAEVKFLASRAIPSERIARKLIQGIRRNPARVMLSVDYRTIDWLSRLFPSFALDFVARRSRRLPF